jgi:tetratricopeptide (TPR) repeat protein
MLDDRVCPKCGQMIPHGTEDCPICRKSVDFYLRRETLLLASFVGLVLLFAIAGFFVNWYHAKQKRLAWYWYTQGEQALQKGNAVEALSDFRSARFNQPTDPAYQLRLASALVAMGRLDEAQAYLSRLWESDPVDGPVNLELGLLAMKIGDVPHVITYFHSAIDGVWNSQPVHRWQLREELVEYLIDHGRRDEALAELTALSAETSNNASRRTQVGNLFLKIQDYGLALKEYRRVLALDRKQPQAWLGAGKAAFALGDYRTARSELAHAVAENPTNPEASRLLHLATRVIEVDAFDPRVPVSERYRRAIFAFHHALERLSVCAASKRESLDVPSLQTELQQTDAEATKMESGMNMQALERNPDLLDQAMRLVFRIESLTDTACGAPSSTVDQALLVIARNNGGPA